MKNNQKIMAGAVFLLATIFLGSMAVALSPDTSLTIERPRMRDITITFDSITEETVYCDVSQRTFSWQDYEYMLSFSLASGKSYEINMQNAWVIYRDLKFSCLAGSKLMTVNSVYVMGGATITVPATPTVCPAQTSCSAQGYILPQDCPTCPINPTCESGGYIFPADCGNYGWFDSCQSCCPTCPIVHQCHIEEQYCNGNDDCCQGLFCHSNHKCEPIGCLNPNRPCQHDSDCCSNDCSYDSQHHRNECD